MNQNLVPQFNHRSVKVVMIMTIFVRVQNLTRATYTVLGNKIKNQSKKQSIKAGIYTKTTTLIVNSVARTNSADAWRIIYADGARAWSVKL